MSRVGRGGRKVQSRGLSNLNPTVSGGSGGRSGGAWVFDQRGRVEDRSGNDTGLGSKGTMSYTGSYQSILALVHGPRYYYVHSTTTIIAAVIWRSLPGGDLLSES
eukprot:1174606-Rhodomonas_salina.1